MLKAIFSSAWESIDQNFYTKLAQSIDPIDSTITFYAEILASGMLKSFDKDGKDVTETDALVALLQNPNENQNFPMFIKEWLYYLLSHGWDYIVPQSTSAGFEKRLDKPGVKTQLFNIDPDYIEWKNETSWMFGLITQKSKEVKFSYKPLGFSEIRYADVISFFDVRQNPERPYTGISRLLALKPHIQNYSLAQQAKENMIKRSGSQLIGLDGKTDDMGLDSTTGTGEFDKDGNPMTTTYKKKLEDQIRSTGIGNNSMGIIFANLPLKVSSLSDGLEKIDFDKLSIEASRPILNKYNLPKEFQNLTSEAAKFQNRQKAMEEVVQNTVEPLGNSFCDRMRTYFNWPNRIILDFSHLPVFSENEATRTETMQAIVNLYQGLLTTGTITEADFKQILKDNGIIG